ncbi:hypothetical protein HMPREF1991_00554 [Hoylesella loescheii DSM 19665 = JCM 12249 = ATCC 15930]|uniref:Uncharacterized protein n=1 Tax=Hoylesella loescheii DSM 19665 = JCM 12249 = ATCC 15930 TaxID=1122985 RepID=A0A069QTZ2_HOYLO|nr:hypothetical protein HMPREF1991_00554 [Hoylesella loescheii DSM 19665 = JCM 12249 = ATCC 15930]
MKCRNVALLFNVTVYFLLSLHQQNGIRHVAFGGGRRLPTPNI